MGRGPSCSGHRVEAVTQTSADPCLALGREEERPFPCRRPQDPDLTLHRDPTPRAGPSDPARAQHICVPPQPACAGGVSLTVPLLSCPPSSWPAASRLLAHREG